MEFPVRCFTCGTVLGHLYDDYKEMVKTKPVEVSLNDLGVTRYCCRRMFMAHVDMVDIVLRYPRV